MIIIALAIVIASYLYVTITCLKRRDLAHTEYTLYAFCLGQLAVAGIIMMPWIAAAKPPSVVLAAGATVMGIVGIIIDAHREAQTDPLSVYSSSPDQ